METTVGQYFQPRLEKEGLFPEKDRMELPEDKIFSCYELEEMYGESEWEDAA